MFSRLFNKRIAERVFSTITHNQPTKSLAEQFNEKKKNPIFFKHFNEIQKKILDLKSNAQHIPAAHISEPTIDRETAEAQERKYKMHSVY